MTDRRKFIKSASIGAGALTAASSIWGANDLPKPSKGAEEQFYEQVMALPVDDNHCHPLTFNDYNLDVASFLERLSLMMFPLPNYFPIGVYSEWQKAFGESKRTLDNKYGISELRNEIVFHVRNTVFVRQLTKEMAKFLGCEDRLETVIEARNAAMKTDAKGYMLSLFKAGNIENAMLDTGYAEGMSGEEMSKFEAAISPQCASKRILRVDDIQKRLFKNKEQSFEELEKSFKNEIIRGLDGNGNYGKRSYGMKSYLLPRIGLMKPQYDHRLAKVDWENYQSWSTRLNNNRVEEHSVDRDVFWIQKRELLLYFHTMAMEECLKRDLPMQFHAGDGEGPKGIMRTQDPFLMEEMIRFEKDQVLRNPKVILIHAGYPLEGRAAWLSQLYVNCYFEVSLATPLIHQGLYRLYNQVLEVVPHSKMVYGSDAYHLPEFYWLGAKWGKHYFALTMLSMVRSSMIGYDEAIEMTKNFCYQNNRRLYGF